MTEISAQTRAERCAAKMFESDAASQNLGMRIDHIGPGTATLSMTLRDDMLNGHRIAHGGFLFTLADSAFAFACNSYNQLTVAQQNQITYMAPGHAGERVSAKATEVSRTGRSGLYDVTVTGDDGRILAVMRGLSRTIKGTHFDETEDGEETQP